MKEQWLEQGYKDFALEGPDNLSINLIGREIGASRSSFYHHFAEIDIFIDELLQMHWSICQAFTEAGKESCKHLIPDLYDLLATYPIPLQFSRQLFRHRHIPRYKYLFARTYDLSSEAFIMDLFARHLDLEVPQRDLNQLFATLGEAWYSRLDPNDLSAATLRRHAEDILQDLSSLMDSGIYSSLRKVP